MNANLIKAFLRELLQQDDATTAHIFGDYLEEQGDPRAESVRAIYSGKLRRVNAIGSVLEFLPQRYAVQFVRECIGRVLPVMEQGEFKDTAPRGLWLLIRGWVSGEVEASEVEVWSEKLKYLKGQIAEELDQPAPYSVYETFGFQPFRPQLYQMYHTAAALIELAGAVQFPEDSPEWRRSIQQARSQLLNVFQSSGDMEEWKHEQVWQEGRLGELLDGWEAGKLV